MTILPQPKKLKKTSGVVATAGLDIVLTSKCDYRILKAAQKLAAEMYEETGNDPVITKVLGVPSPEGKIVIDCLNKKTEGYKLSARPTVSPSPVILSQAHSTVSKLSARCLRPAVKISNVVRSKINPI